MTVLCAEYVPLIMRVNVRLAILLLIVPDVSSSLLIFIVFFKGYKTLLLLLICTNLIDTCPTSPAWVGKAYTENSARIETECGHKGMCNRNTVCSVVISSIVCYLVYSIYHISPFVGCL